MKFFEARIMLQLVVGNLLEHRFTKRIIRSLGVLEIKLTLLHFVVEGYFQCVEAFFIVHTISSFLQVFSIYQEILLDYRPDYEIGQGGGILSVE